MLDLYIILFVTSGVILVAGMIATPIVLDLYLKLCEKDYNENND